MPVNQFVIIGIHGLAKKPAKRTLTRWWGNAICEGLNHNIRKYKVKNITSPQLNFSMVYWNHLMGKNRLLTLAQLKKKQDHYQKALKGDIRSYQPRSSDKMRIMARDFKEDIIGLMIGITQNQISRVVMQKFLEDLYQYYDNLKIRNALQNCLIANLAKHKNKRIMLISHSMGTIIAYDVLRQLALKEDTPIIEHFITMGSPLGLPFITKRDRMRGTPSVPDNVKKWSNFADMSDPVCTDPYLADDYKKSKIGINVVDQLVLNDWPHDKYKLSHKSYGYLRTPEVSKTIAKFL